MRRRKKDNDEEKDGGVSSNKRIRLYENRLRWTIYVRGDTMDLVGLNSASLVRSLVPRCNTDTSL